MSSLPSEAPAKPLHSTLDSMQAGPTHRQEKNNVSNTTMLAGMPRVDDLLLVVQTCQLHAV